MSLFGHMGHSVVLKPTVHEPQSYVKVLREVHSNNISEAGVGSLDTSLLLHNCKVFHKLPHFLKLLIFASHIFWIRCELSPRRLTPRTGIKKPT